MQLFSPNRSISGVVFRLNYPEASISEYFFVLSFQICHGIVTAVVLELGLSRGAIAARKLKGVKWDKEHEGYTGSAPYGEGKSLLQLTWN